ncbi:MAG: iron-sulfur cluster assembly protein [Bifidobacteriaceae bacterium]|jgi:metal-sulfur cluster biosynthetic enzyme|nr:iron-sulfur cluster assembly protein [Bifidobacteriaceae bacterium]
MDNAYLNEQKVLDTLSSVIDPELGVSIVDLGLVYKIDLQVKFLKIDVTLTTPTCPLTSYIEEQIYEVLSGIAVGVKINWVWDPPWSIEKITDSGKQQLQAIGYNIG